MKKFFTLVAMALMAVGANAQSVVGEIDWTKESAYYEGVWYADLAEVSVEEGVGLIINCTQTNPDANYWEPQVPMIAHMPAIAEGGQYQVTFDVNAPAAGEIRLDFCSWDGTGATKDWIHEVAAGDNEFTVDFLDYPTECTDAMIFYQCGKIPGKHVIKHVKVVDLEGEPTEPTEPSAGIVGEIDWTKETAYYEGVWYADLAEVSVEEGVGLIINCTQTNPDANYWEPQVPMIAHMPAIAEGGQYQVTFDVNAPAAGEIRLDFCSWDGTGATKDWIHEVAAGDNEFTVDFLDYPTECTDAMIFYQCGKIPGKHIIKHVKVVDLEASAIKNVKATKVVNNARYNLAGQKVDASYKGIVIQNGKKFIQK